MDGPGAAGRGYTRGLKAGDVGYEGARASQEDSGALCPGLCCTDQTSHHENTFFKAKKSLFALGGDFWLFPGSQTGAGQGGQWMDPYLKPL